MKYSKIISKLNKNKDFRKKRAFTLAEVLITLAIIGVVAALTIPALMQKTQDQELKTAWKKEYSVFSNTFNMIKQENGGTLAGLDINSVTASLSTILNAQKSCAYGDTKAKCWHDAGKSHSLSGTPAWTDAYSLTTQSTGFILTDGALINIFWPYTNCNSDWDNMTHRFFCGLVQVDVNGFKGPNVQGKDIFILSADKNVTYPGGTQGDYSYAISSHGCDPTDLTDPNQGFGCSAKYIKE